MASVTLSETYIDALNSFIKFIKPSPTHEVLFFKHDDGFVYLSKMDVISGCWVNLKTKMDNLDFELKEVGVINIDDFLNYLDNVNYPTDSNASVTYKVAKSSSSAVEMPMFQVLGKGTKFFLPLANTDCFVSDYDRKVPCVRDEDPLRLVSKFTLKVSDITSLRKNMNLMDWPKVFAMSIVNDNINIYAKGSSNQQFEKTIDKLCTKIFNGYTTAVDAEDPLGCKVFPSGFIKTLDYFGIDFDIDIRLKDMPDAPPIMIIKAYGLIDNSKIGKSNIEVLVATHESQSESMTGTYEIMV